MGQDGAQAGHRAAVFDVLSGEEVQLVKVLGIRTDNDAAIGILNVDNGLEHHPLALLDELSHGVEVRSIGDGSGENALALLALGLAVKLLPPLAQILELGIVGNHYLNLFPEHGVKEIADCGILYGNIVLALKRELLLHFGGACEHGADIKAGHHYRKQSYGSKDGETAAYVIGNNKRAVTLLSREGLQRTLPLIGDGDDALRSILVILLYKGLYDAEGHGRLGRGAALGYHDASDIALGGKVHQLGKILLGEVVAGKNHVRSGLGALAELVEVARKGFNGAAGPEVGAADADDNDKVDALGLPVVTHSLEFSYKALGSAARQVFPAEKVVAGSLFAV